MQSDPALIEALWTGALDGYARCFSGQYKVLSDSDLGELELDDTVAPMHSAYKKLRDTFASRHVNPREQFTVGAALDEPADVAGIAVTSTTMPVVDDQTVRLLGRVAYSLSALIDARMQNVQAAVLTAASALTPVQLLALPEVDLAN